MMQIGEEKIARQRASMIVSGGGCKDCRGWEDVVDGDKQQIARHH